jgi:hypothetical protein
MTLAKFSVLNDEQKALIVWEGEFMTYREEKDFIIMLYKVYDFYVEVYYNKQNNKLIRFNPFSSKKRLELYFDVSLN